MALTSSGNDIVIRIRGDSNVGDVLKNDRKSLQRFENQTQQTSKTAGSAFTQIRTALAGAGIGAAASYATTQLVQFEEGLVGVGKTANLQDDELEGLGERIENLSTQIPAATDELLANAEAAGRLGVEGADNILNYTETIAKLGRTTDLQGEQAATTLARIQNVTGEAASEVDTLASVLVSLGNNMAASEGEIAKLTNEVARSTTEFDLSSAQAAALGATLAEMGIRAQSGGSSVGRAFRAIRSAIANGGEEMRALQQVTRMTSEELQTAFEEDAVAVFQRFVEGLGNLQEEGGNAAATLDGLGLSGEEILKVLPPLAQNADSFGEALDRANAETRDATALQEEFSKAAESLGSNLKRAYNSFDLLVREAAAPSTPYLKESADGFSNLAKRINEINQAADQDPDVSWLEDVISYGAAGAYAASKGYRSLFASWSESIQVINKLSGNAEEAGEAVNDAGEEMEEGLDGASGSAKELDQELSQIGKGAQEAISPALDAIGKLEESLQSQAEKQARLREEVFKATGGASKGYFQDQTSQIKDKASEMLGAGIGQRDVADWFQQQVQQLQKEAQEAGATLQAATLKQLQGSASTIVGRLARETKEAGARTQELQEQYQAAEEAVAQVRDRMGEVLPEERASAVQSRLDELKRKLVGLQDNADVRADVDASQAYSEIQRIEREIAAIPDEVVTRHRIVSEASGDTPPPPEGSRATGGEVTADGLYRLEAGERVVSDSSQTFGDINVYGGGGSLPTDPAQLRAWVRGTLMPELQAAMDR